MYYVEQKDNFIERRIHGSYFLIDITDNYRNDTCALHEINETGLFLWTHMKGKTTANELARELQKAISDPISFDVILRDVEDYIRSLAADNLVEVTELG